MAEQIEADVLDFGRFEEAMKKAPVFLYQELKRRGGKFMAMWIGQAIQRGRFGGGSGKLQSRTGSLSRAMMAATMGADIGSLRFPAGTIRQGLPYALLQEFGGTITPKRAKWLTIPLDDAKTPAGVARYSAREALSQPGTFFLPLRGKLFIVRKQEEALTFLFILLKRVVIAGKLGFFDSWKRNEPGFMKAVSHAVERALERLAREKEGAS